MTEKATEREQCLKTALQYVTKDRNAQHGDPERNFQNIANLCNAMFGTKGGIEEFKPHHIAMIMIAVKLARLIESPGNFDNWTDLAGYAACGWECAVEEAR